MPVACGSDEMFNPSALAKAFVSLGILAAQAVEVCSAKPRAFAPSISQGSSRSRVPFHLDHGHFDHVTVGLDRLMPVVAPAVHLPGRGPLAGQGILDRAIDEGIALPYLSYGYSSFFGVALGRLFAECPPSRRQSTHENTISAGLKTLAPTGAGLCWLPESLIGEELAAGSLVLASQSERWTLALEIRLYRHRASKSRPIEALWQAVNNMGPPHHGNRLP